MWFIGSIPALVRLKHRHSQTLAAIILAQHTKFEVRVSSPKQRILKFLETLGKSASHVGGICIVGFVFRQAVHGLVGVALTPVLYVQTTKTTIGFANLRMLSPRGNTLLTKEFAGLC